MIRSEIASELRRVTDGQAFITSTQLARAFGCAKADKVKEKYLKNLEAIDGKYYLIKEVADVLFCRKK